MRVLTMVGLALLAGLCFTGAAVAQEKVDGTWEWTTPGRGDNAQPVKYVLKLKVEGEKLTGTITGRDGKEAAIEEATVKGADIAFQVTRQRNDQKMVMKYAGKVEGDAIKGKISFKRGDEDQSRDWAAKRAK